MAYQIRSYRSGDEEEIVSLLRAAFPAWSQTENALEVWRWRYLDNPEKSYVIVAEHDGRIVSVNHFAYHYIKIGDSSLLSILSGNVVTHPDHRGKGLYSQLQKFASETMTDFRFSIWSSSNPIIMDANKRSGYGAFPHTIRLMVRIRDIDAYLEAKKPKSATVKKYGYLALSSLNRARRAFSLRPRSGIGPEIIQVSMFSRDNDDFWEENRCSFNYAIERSSRYLNWRYADPRGRYEIKQARDDGRLQGHIITETKGVGDGREGYISDLTVAPARLDVAHSLMGDACDHLDKEGINSTYFWAPAGNPLVDVAERYGFVDSMYKMYIGYRFKPIDDGPRILELSEPKRVHFQFGDTDLF